jgi:hypothetical protein
MGIFLAGGGTFDVPLLKRVLSDESHCYQSKLPLQINIADY